MELKGAETFVGDAIAIDALAGGRGFSLVSPPARETYEIAGRLISASQTVHQLAIRVEDGVNGAYYCELYDDGTSFRLNFTYTLDSVVYTVIDSQLLAGRFQPGTFRLILDCDPPNLTCIAEWMGTTTTVTGAIPGGLSPAQLSVGAYLLSVELDSFTRVTTP